MKLLIVFTVFAIGVLAEVARFDFYRVYRVYPKDPYQLEILQEIAQGNLVSEMLGGYHLGGEKIFLIEFKCPAESVEQRNAYEFWTRPSMLNQSVDIMVPPDKRDEFTEIMEESALKLDIFIADVQKLIDQERENRTEKRDMDWKSYHSLEEFDDWMEKLAEENPNVKKIIVGRTYENRSINAIEITFHEDRPTVFMESGIHAREWIAPAATSYVVNEILHSNESSVFREFNYIYVPFINPDGYVYSWTTDRMWTKTRKPYEKNHFVCYGADPNRNWDYKWEGNPKTDDHCHEDYPGPEPFSEVETKSLSEFFKEYAKERKIDVYLSFHSYSQMLLYPWASRPDPAPLDKTWEKIAYSAAQPVASGVDFVVGDTYDAYSPIPGSSADWFYANYRSTITFTYELKGRNTQGFLLSPDLIEPTGMKLAASIQIVLQEYKQL